MNEDAGLVSRIRHGDLRALEEPYQKYKRPPYQTALAITGDRGAAEETLQDCLVRAYGAMGRVEAAPLLSPMSSRSMHRLESMLRQQLSQGWIAGEAIR